jgi:hypothetical protein
MGESIVHVDTFDLSLLRRADAGDPDAWPRPEAEGPLTAEGRRHADLLGRHLASIGFTVDIILTSPKARATDTAALAVSWAFGTPRPSAGRGRDPRRGGVRRAPPWRLPVERRRCRGLSGVAHLGPRWIQQPLTGQIGLGGGSDAAAIDRKLTSSDPGSATPGMTMLARPVS